jgi:rare lipoprotein A
MRLPVDAARRLASALVACGLSLALAACGTVDGLDGVETTQGAPLSVVGPAADYPMVLGEPFTVDGKLYTPADTLNYDAVGYAGTDDGFGVTAAHRTLPLPSYAEVTSLDSGRTILVRVERRGPMTGANLTSLSAAAAAQLQIGEGAPVRIRRVNPPEAERAELRAGRAAPERMETPKSLVQVLRRKLPEAGVVSLASAPPVNPAGQSDAVPASVAALVPASAHPVPARAVGAYPLPRIGAPPAPPRPASVTQAAPAPHAGTAQALRPGTAARAAATTAVAPVAKGAFIIQAGAFANRANAERAAKHLGGFISPSGRLFRVRTGPFTTRSQADAALAKVRLAGYSDARVTTAD